MWSLSELYAYAIPQEMEQQLTPPRCVLRYSALQAERIV